MASLIGQVRGLTFAGTAEYTLGDATYFADGHIQEILDRHCMDIWRERLVPEERYDAAGAVSYNIFHSSYGNIEAGTALIIEDAVGADRGTATFSADYQRGVFTFTTDQQGTALYLTGRTFDPFGAAAEVLESWAASEARSFDFSADGQSFNRSQKVQSLRDQARILRKRARITTKRLRTG
jgi:hypothetical protein